MWDHSNAAALPNNVVQVVVMWRIVEGNGFNPLILDFSGTETLQWVVTESVPQCCLNFMANITTMPEDWTGMGERHLYTCSQLHVLMWHTWHLLPLVVSLYSAHCE